MRQRQRPVSLIAEKAVRYLSDRKEPVGSVELAGQVLATTVPDEETGRRVLAAAFAGDDRLWYESGWRARPSPTRPRAAAADPDLAFLLVDGERPHRRAAFRMRSLTAVRLAGAEVLQACGGEPVEGTAGDDLRSSVLAVLDGAIPVVHDAPGALAACERWLGEPLDRPVSLRRLASQRLGLQAGHGLADLAARLGLRRRDPGDPAEMAEVLDACLSHLRRAGESVHDLRGEVDPPPRIEWSRFDFDRAALRSIPRQPGTYRFFDRDGGLVYVGKAKDLRQRVASYFREGAARSARVQRILDTLHRLEVEPSGSDLEALLREAAAIRRQSPAANVQRRVHAGGEHRRRLGSILLLEPAARPHVLCAYLLHDGRLVGKVGIGRRGAGLARVARLLEDHFFGIPLGPSPALGPEVEVEIVSRWLAAHRDRVVAFDPTDLGSAAEVVRRLRWFLERGSLRDPDGTPILTR